jgi:hypothetical protein
MKLMNKLLGISIQSPNQISQVITAHSLVQILTYELHIASAPWRLQKLVFLQTQLHIGRKKFKQIRLLLTTNDCRHTRFYGNLGIT